MSSSTDANNEKEEDASNNNDASQQQQEKKKKRILVVEPCPPAVATAYLVLRGACLGVVGGSMDDVSCSMMQPTFIKEKRLTGKFSLNVGKKLGTACQLDLPEDATQQTELLQAFQTAANRIVRDSNSSLSMQTMPLQQAVDTFGKGILNDGLKKTKPDQEVTVAWIPNVVLAISPAAQPALPQRMMIMLEQQQSAVHCGKKARKAELVLKFRVELPQDVGIQLASSTELQKNCADDLKVKEIRMPEGKELFQKQQHQEVPTVETAKADLKDEQDSTEKMVVTMEEVSGKVDYDVLVKDFGSRHITPEILDKLKQVSGGRVEKLHRFLRRGIFFSHRDLDLLLDAALKGQPLYLYTGRGPSSAAMHLGHLIPFLFTKWLQEALDCPLVIQMTDDEKFLFKGTYTEQDGDDLMEFAKLTMENARDIIACGFDFDKTFLFSDLDYVGRMYPNVCRIWKAVTTNTVNGIFGFDGTSNIGKVAFPAIQAAPSFASSFPTVLGTNSRKTKMSCLIPCAIDQDPYFRMTRDVAHKLVVAKDHPLGGKPALVHSKFFPPLQGTHGKMSSSDANSAIFLTDSPQDIERKIKQHAYSGGQDTKEKQQELGADLEVDVAYQWLRFFMEDDDELERIGREYGSGQGEYWSTGKVKQRLVQVLHELVGQHQKRRAQITDEEVKKWMTERCLV